MSFYNRTVELSYGGVDYHWSCPDYYKNSDLIGTYNEPGKGHYSVDCEFRPPADDTFIRMSGLLKEDKLRCNVDVKPKDGYPLYSNEIYLLEDER